MLSAAERARLLAPFADARRVLLAVSGGPDSLALLELAAAWRAAGGAAPIAAATFDHGLRAQSQAEARSVAALCARLAVPHATLVWEGPKPATGLQERARDARYAALCAHAHAIGADVLATAHHADDQAETVLMRLARGSGVTGLAGMRPRSRLHGLTLLRPLLAVPKRELVALCEAAGLAYARDPSNEDERFARARLRGLAPALTRAGVTAERLGRLARRAARADEALERLAERAAERAGVVRAPTEARVPLAALMGEPDEIILRIIVAEARRVGGERPVRLSRVEAAAERLMRAAREGHGETTSLAGALLRLDALGTLAISPEPPRRRGRIVAGATELVHVNDEMGGPNTDP